MFKLNRNACHDDDGTLVIEASTACLPPGHWPAAVEVNATPYALEGFETAGEEIVAARYVDPKTRNVVCIIND